MIEVPHGVLTADEIALAAEFFSFGTNDLTQTAPGMSRDDSGCAIRHGNPPSHVGGSQLSMRVLNSKS